MIYLCTNPATWHPTLHRKEEHHHPPKSWTNDNGVNSRIITLCGICHNEYHALLNEYVRVRGVPSWDVRKTYSPFIRNLVTECWDTHIPGKTPFTTVDGTITQRAYYTTHE